MGRQMEEMDIRNKVDISSELWGSNARDRRRNKVYVASGIGRADAWDELGYEIGISNKVRRVNARRRAVYTERPCF